MSQSRKIAVLDIDNVLLDYNAAYGFAWFRCFGKSLERVYPDAYLARHQWEAPKLQGVELKIFEDSFDEGFFSTLELIDGAMQVCEELKKRDYELVAVTASKPEFNDCRFQRLLELGLPIDSCHSVGRKISSPKAKLVNQLGASIFVDDSIEFFEGVDPHIVRILINRNDGAYDNPKKHYFKTRRHEIKSMRELAECLRHVSDFPQTWIDYWKKTC